MQLPKNMGLIHLRHSCFNTASGKHCYFITFVFPSLRSGTRDVQASSSLCSSAGTLRRIPQAVSTVTSSPLFSLPFGQGLEMCGPHRRFAPLLPRTLRRIPQAVGTVATDMIFEEPEAVSFNTASGKKHCCNSRV